MIEYEDNVLVESEIETTDKTKKGKVIVWNDNFNTFEHVANMLVLHCNMDYDRAMQCAHTIHNAGKCVVYTSDDYVELEFIRVKLLLNLLTVTLD